MADRRRTDQRRDQLAAAVRRHIDQGQLTLGQQLLAAAPADEQTHRIAGELAARRATVHTVGQKVDSALRAGNWEAALDQLARLDRQVARHPEIRDLCAKVNASIVAEATKAIESGRLDEAKALLRRHEELPGRFIDADGLREALRQCREASTCLERVDAAGAERSLRTLAGQWPNASWIPEALGRVQQIRTSAEALLAGPLGAAGAAGPLPSPPPEYREREDSADRDFVLHVDGAGGFRVVGGQAVTFGPVGASRQVDVAVTGDASVPLVTITRSDEDYFVQSRQPVEVNDKPTTHALLANGDRIAIGPRCRLRFRRPNPASTSAVLDVTAGRLARGDVRQVILFDRELIIGPGPAAHVRVDSLGGPAVLQRGAAGLVCRAADPIRLDGQLAGTEPLIRPGVHVTIGPIGLILVREERGAAS
jgi:hypothetical protein